MFLCDLWSNLPTRQSNHVMCLKYQTCQL
jgi:hypothetical protein